jgi:hypothetical protein
VLGKAAATSKVTNAAYNSGVSIDKVDEANKKIEEKAPRMEIKWTILPKRDNEGRLRYKVDTTYFSPPKA